MCKDHSEALGAEREPQLTASEETGLGPASAQVVNTLALPRPLTGGAGRHRPVWFQVASVWGFEMCTKIPRGACHSVKGRMAMFIQTTDEACSEKPRRKGLGVLNFPEHLQL